MGYVLIGNGSWFSGAVVAPTAPNITTTVLPTGTVGTFYSSNLTATGSTPITWSVTSGNSTLTTANLTLTSSGLLSGTPANTVTGFITVQATNSAGNANATLSLTVSAAVNNTITLSLPTGTATNYPYQFGRVFKQGVIANYPQVLIGGSAQTTQADVKNRWPDGSVKFAVISCIIPSLSTSNTTITFQNQASSNNTAVTVSSMLSAYDFNCTINATVSNAAITGAPVSARTILAALSDATLASNTANASPNSQYWTQGPICTTVILADHTSKSYDFGTTSDKSLRPIFHVQFWPTINKYRVRAIVENGDVTKIQTQTYDVSVSTGNASPTTVYTKNTVVHVYNGRWTKAFWSGTAPASVNIDHNANYLANTKFIPYFDPTAKLTETQIQSNYTYWGIGPKEIFDNGNDTYYLGWDKSMPDVAGKPERALLPNWNVDALLTADYRLQQIADNLTELALAWPMHQREGSNTKYYDAEQTIPAIGFPVSLYARPTMFYFDNGAYDFISNSGIPSAADAFTFISPTTGTSSNGWNCDGAHQPAPFFLPYLTTGEYVWLEQMQFWASWGAFNPQPNTTVGFYARGPTLTSFALNGDIRRRAWCFRNRVYAAVFSIDGSKEKTYYENAITQAITIEEGIRDVTGGSGYGNASYVWGQTTGRSGSGTGDNYGEYGPLVIHPLHFWDVNKVGCESFASNTYYNAPLNTTVQRAQAPFQMAYILLALANAKDLGYATDGLRNWAAVFVTGAITETLNTGNSQIGMLLGNYIVPVVTAAGSYIPSWAATSSYYTNLNYPTNYVTAAINSPDSETASMSAAIAMNYDISGMSTAWDWVNTNWIALRNSPSPTPSRWRILPRP
jgi:hypothetical protein